MNGVWDQHHLPSHAVHHGVMAKGNWAADYYTSQPDPGCWIAVGLVAPLDTATPVLRRMLVREGRAEDNAINALWIRVAELSGDNQFTVFSEPSTDRAHGNMVGPTTCARVYLAGGDRLTVPCAAFVREDPARDFLDCTDADGFTVKRLQREHVIGYLIFTCQSEDCFQT